MNNSVERKGKATALLPLIVFVAIYLSIALITNDFYAMPVTVPFLIAAVVALLMNKKESINDKVEIFCKGAGDSNIILMCLIFILAGAFAQVAKDMGAVESTVNLGLKILPSNILISGIFIIGCFISTSIGTSVGTIVALSPMAVGVADKTGISVALILGSVIGGAMFGDNLSMISDTTIAATRTQGCEMRDKFKTNFFIVLPAAIITAVLFAVITAGNSTTLSGNYQYSIVKVIPYLSVLIAALLGVNVILVLVGGVVLSGIVGIATGSMGVIAFLQSIAKGIAGMSELVIVSLVIGGTVEIIKHNGGIDFLLYFITSKVKSRKGAELAIGLLVTLVDACTANNTIAIVTTGPLAKSISSKYNIEPQKTASLLDTFSCFAQGVIPYGAQLLVASGIAGISPFLIMKYLYYPYLIGISAVIAIVIGFPRIKNIEVGSLEKVI